MRTSCAGASSMPTKRSSALRIAVSRKYSPRMEKPTSATESAASKGDGGVGDSTPQAAPEVSGEAAATAAAAAAADGDMMDEEAELMQQAMAMSRGYDPAFYAGNAGMDEDEALARAMAMSMEGTQPAAEAEGGEPDPTDPEYMASVLANLPGVNPDDPALKDALDNLKKGGGDS